MQKNRAVASARAFLNCPFDIIVDMLSLHPKDDWHLWLDPEGNRLRILKTKNVKVYPAVEKIPQTKDVFRKANPELIIKNSYWGTLIIGQNKKILILLGNDGKLRCSYFVDNIWIENICPLLLGFDILRYIASGYLESNTREIKQLKITYPHDFEIEDAWAFGLPVEDTNIHNHLDTMLINRNI
jgi:hypothetical protein